MLLQFSVENFLSFREPTVLSMLAAPGVSHPQHIVVSGPENRGILRCSAIYGANASGKSNLIKALDTGIELVRKGTRARDPLPARPHKLDPACMTKPSRFEWEIAVSEKRFSYGFEITQTTVVSEWLYCISGDQEQALFTREKGEIKLGEGLSKTARSTFIEYVAEGTRPNQLFLTEASERNVVELTPVIDSLCACRVVRPDIPFTSTVKLIETNPDLAAEFGLLLASMGTGIEKIEIRRFSEGIGVDLYEKNGSREEAAVLVAEMAKLAASGLWHMEEKDGKTDVRVVMAVHRAIDGGEVPFTFYEESDGTKRLLQLAPALSGVSGEESITLYAIDELERSLHPLLTREFVSRFLAAENTRQLVFTTHDTNLLDLELLSSDAIWFTEKNPAGATNLYSLAEFKSDQLGALGTQIEKGYLQGRFGAIPFIGDPARLGWKNAAQ
ncbi:MAG: ATP-binding protein [Polyangiaceae bacterium]|nr:ATP-binding protein [Polyangiaceae bacterium]